MGAKVSAGVVYHGVRVLYSMQFEAMDIHLSHFAGGSAHVGWRDK